MHSGIKSFELSLTIFENNTSVLTQDESENKHETDHEILLIQLVKTDQCKQCLKENFIYRFNAVLSATVEV